jgi:SNF2 family DNA or RNA helicase
LEVLHLWEGGLLITLGLDKTGTKLSVYFPYDPKLVDLIKLFQGRRWEKPSWTLPLSQEMVSEVEAAFKVHGPVMIHDGLTAHLKNQQGRSNQVLHWRQTGDVPALPADFYLDERLYEHQKKAVAYCLAREKFGIFMEQGTGKTLVLLQLLRYLKKHGANMPALVVCPVSVISAWVKQAREFTPDLRIGVCRGTPKQRDQILAEAEHGKLDILLINYELLHPCCQPLRKIKFGTMILDESQKIKHRGTLQAKAAMKISDGVQRRYILTGTPMANSPLDIFNQIRFLDPTVFGHSWYGYRDRYAIMGGYGGYQQLGWKNLEELTTKLAGISYRVLKKDCLDLPEKVYQEFRLDMGDEQKKCYKELAEDLVTTVKNAIIATPVVLAKLAKLRQMASGFVYSADGEMLTLKENPKIVQLKEILGEIHKDHKVVIWTSFQAEMRAIKNLCLEMKLEYVSVDGSVSQDERAVRIQSFQEVENVRVFIGQQHAGGVGITLTAADYCVFYSNDYSYEVRVQAEDRLHRIGQKNRVVYIDLIMKGSVEGVIKRALAKKTDLAERITPSNVTEMLFDKEEADA